LTTDDHSDHRPIRHTREPSRPRDITLADSSDLADLADVAERADVARSASTADVARSASTADGQRMRAADRALARLRLLGETTRAIGAALGLAPDELATREAFDRIGRDATLSVEQVAELSEGAMRQWFDTLGADLELDLALEGLDPTLEPVRAELRAADDPAGALAIFQAEALAVAETQGDAVSVSAQLRIGKRQAQSVAETALAERRAAHAGAALAPETALVFYSAAACERILTLRAAPQWRERGLGADETRLCVVICDSVGVLAGPALEILGAASADAPGEWLPVSRAAWRRFVERAAAARRLRDVESAWSGFALALLPDHLRVMPRALGLERIAGRLQALRAQVAACALASHVERADDGGQQGDLTLRFAGARPAVARLASAVAPGDLEALPRDALIELADWAYRDASPDKLAIARQALAETLTAGATLTLAQFCVAAAPALDVARANFAIYLRGATERYFQLRASAQQTVSGFADATRAAVASLTSDVTDNLYRTVGLIVGVAIAWLIQPSASLILAQVAAALYTLYVAFIVGYLLRARHDRFRLERKGLDDTLAAMSELTPAERARLRAPAHDAEAYFETYYRWTRIMYLVVAGLGIVVFVLLLTPLAHTLAHR